MVSGDGIGDILHEDGLTRLGLCDDECTLAFTDRREQVDDAHAGIGGILVAAECEFLFREERSQVLKGDSVTNLRRQATIDGLDCRQREIFLVLVRRADGAVDDIACLQTIALDLRRRYIDIIGRGEIVVVAGTDETVTIGQHLKYTITSDNVREVVAGSGSLLCTNHCLIVILLL